MSSYRCVCLGCGEDLGDAGVWRYRCPPQQNDANGKWEMATAGEIDAGLLACGVCIASPQARRVLKQRALFAAGALVYRGEHVDAVGRDRD